MSDSRPTVWLAGASGRLASALLRIFPEPKSFAWLPTTHEEADLTRFSDVARVLREHRPVAVVNAAAVTDVDGAEQMPEEELFRTNVLPLMQMRELEPRLPLLQVSSDYVFGGDEERDTPYEEEDLTDPVNRYGLSKQELEQYLLANHPRSYVLRTSWLYGPRTWSERRSFYRSIAERALAGTPLRVVEDEAGSPTSALTLARVICRLLADLLAGKGLPFGLYHVADEGETSRFSFARAIAQEVTGRADYPVTPIRRADLALPARRPRYSALSAAKLQKYYPDLLRPWSEALREVVMTDTTHDS